MTSFSRNIIVYCLIGSASFSANIQLYPIKTSHLPFFYVELLFKISLAHDKSTDEPLLPISH